MKLIIDVWSETLSFGELKGADNSPLETTIMVRESLVELYDIFGLGEEAKSFAVRAFTKTVVNICKNHSQDNIRKLFMRTKYSS